MLVEHSMGQKQWSPGVAGAGAAAAAAAALAQVFLGDKYLRAVLALLPPKPEVLPLAEVRLLPEVSLLPRVTLIPEVSLSPGVLTFVKSLVRVLVADFA